METIVGLFTGSSSINSRKDDDFVDRLSNKYTVLLLIVFTAVIGSNQYGGDSITCWSPQHFTSNHIKYMNAICWVENTYYIPFEDRLPREGEDPGKMIPYYQWITFILLFQALLFFMPSLLWHSFNQKAGIDADNILSYAQTFTQANKSNESQNTLMMIRNQLDRFLVTRKSLSNLQFKHEVTKYKFMSRRFGGYLTLLYIITKILYLANVVGQLLVLNSVLSVDFGIYGIEVILWMLNSKDWTESPGVAFPRVTMCNFHIRRLGNVPRNSVQCVLPINMYTEKIYTFLWFWMIFVAITTAFSLLMWLGRVIYSQDRITYVRNHLKMLKKLKTETDDERSVKFIKDYLKLDGVFLLRLIGHNTNSVAVSDIIGAMWDLWKLREEDKFGKSCNSTVNVIEEDEMASHNPFGYSVANTIAKFQYVPS